MSEVLLMKNVWVPCENSFTLKEQVDIKTGDRKYILRGMMLPFNKISRNNVLYNKESIIEKHKNLIGRPVMYNHKVDTDALPVGHYVESTIEDDGWYYAADIDPHEKDMIRKLERGDLRHTSIQLIGGKVVEKLSPENRAYTEAWVSDIIEGSIVPAPGFLDTTAKFSEAFKSKENIVMEGTALNTVTGEKVPFKTEMFTEDMTTATGSGAIQPTQDLEDKEVAYECESILSELGEKEALNILKEFSHTVGEVVMIPAGIDNKDLQNYQGQIGLIVKDDDKSYTLEMRDGRKVKIDKEVIDINVLTS